MSLNVLHVMQQHSLGGASRSLVALAGHATREFGSRHRIASLIAPHANAVDFARAEDIDVLAAPGMETLTRAIDAADLVHVHFWNTPELVTFMRACDRPMRSVLWADVAGDTAPHVVTPALIDWADAFVASCHYTATLPIFAGESDPERRAKCHTVLATADFARVDKVRPAPHDGFNVGYIGTVDFTKMDRRYVAMHVAINVPGLKCLIYGSGDGFRILARQAAASGAADRFELGGYTHDIGDVIARLDVFGYPLAAGTSAAGELVLQEVMRVGVPCVIFRRGGAPLVVRHNETGIVVDTESEYIAAIEYLFHHPEERRRMGAAAARASRDMFDARRAALDLRTVYEELMLRPKHPHAWLAPPYKGAALFVDTLGGLQPEFDISRWSGDDQAILEAETIIQRSRENLTTAAAGGILHYRRAFPDDAYLRLWSGLVMLESGRPALAAAEFDAARTLGLDHWRTSWYLAEAARRAGSHDLANDALNAVRQRAPSFASRRMRIEEDPGRLAVSKSASRPKTGPVTRVSVVMATRNAARYLRESLDSIAAQTYPAHEIIVVDGGSTDDTCNIARSYANVRVIPETGSGFAGAWNDGIDAATGDCLSFLDSDDRWMPRKLEWQVAALDADPDAMGAIGQVRFFMAPGERRPPGFKLELLERDYVAHMPGALIARRSLFDVVGRFDTGWTIASDIDWFAKLKDLGCRILAIPELVIRKRVHDTNLSYVTATTPVMNQEILKLLRQSILRQRERERR